MLSAHDIDVLLGFADQSPWRLPNGGWLVVHVEVVDQTPQRPHGLDYALVLQNSEKQRLLGIDNSHGYDGAPDNAPFDHEHLEGSVERRVPYAFRSASQLITDFFDRCEAYCKSNGIAFDLQPEATYEG